jgi:hypothetical protein
MFAGLVREYILAFGELPLLCSRCLSRPGEIIPRARFMVQRIQAGDNSAAARGRDAYVGEDNLGQVISAGFPLPVVRPLQE